MEFCEIIENFSYTFFFVQRIVLKLFMYREKKTSHRIESTIGCWNWCERFTWVELRTADFSFQLQASVEHVQSFMHEKLLTIKFFYQNFFFWSVNEWRCKLKLNMKKEKMFWTTQNNRLQHLLIVKNVFLVCSVLSMDLEKAKRDEKTQTHVAWDETRCISSIQQMRIFVRFPTLCYMFLLLFFSFFSSRSNIFNT